MKLKLLSDKEDISLTIINKITKEEVRCRDILRNILDHAWLNRDDVNYNSSESILTIKLKRHDEISRAKNKFLGFTWWFNAISPNKQCVLTVRDIDSCEIRDDVPSKHQEIIIGGIAFDGDKVYIGAFCEYEEPYGITLKVKKININLEDLE